MAASAALAQIDAITSSSGRLSAHDFVRRLRAGIEGRASLRQRPFLEGLIATSRTAIVFAAAILATSALETAQALAAGDARHGQQLFQARCGLCHSGGAGDGDGGMGPALMGVVGRKAGSLPGFGYTAALKAYAKPWTPELLQTFLAAPGKLVPGTAMPVAVHAPTDRADLVAYLATLKK